MVLSSVVGESNARKAHFSNAIRRPFFLSVVVTVAWMIRNNAQSSRLWLGAIVTDERWTIEATNHSTEEVTASYENAPAHITTRNSSTNVTTNGPAATVGIPTSVHKDRIPLIDLINTEPNPPCDPGKSNKKLINSTILSDHQVYHPNRHIPKIIHMTSKTRCMTPFFLKNIDKWRFQGYALYFHDDAAVDRLLEKHWPEFPHLQQMLSCSISGAAKADIWRLLVLWEYGGIYADVDSAPGFLFQNASAINDDDEAWFVIEKLGIMSQYFMASTPRHPFFHTAILTCLERLNKVANIDKQYVPFVTGPGTIKEAMRFFMKATEATQFEKVKKGKYVGIGGRSVTVMGSPSLTEQWIKREAVNGIHKIGGYAAMRMVHFSRYESKVSNASCVEHLHWQVEHDSVQSIAPHVTSSGERSNTSLRTFSVPDVSRALPGLPTGGSQGNQEPLSHSTIPLVELINSGQEPDCNSSDLLPFPNTVLNESTTHPPGRQIPKIIHMTGRIRCVPERLKQNLDKWRFDGYSIYFHDDAAVDRLLSKYFPAFPHLQLLSNCVISGAGKADLWRYLVLWEYGGIYTDIDNAPGFKFENASVIQDTDEAWFVVERIGVLSQYFMASSPKHPIMFIAMMECLSRLLVLVDKIGTQYVPYITGPGVTKSALKTFINGGNISRAKAGIYTGVGRRKITVVGTRKTSQDWIVRDSIKAKELLYRNMKMDHWSVQKNETLTDSCFEYLYKLSG